MRPDRLCALAIATVLAAGAAFAQTSKTPAQGDAFVTRFSGTTGPASEAAATIRKTVLPFPLPREENAQRPTRSRAPERPNNIIYRQNNKFMKVHKRARQIVC